MPAVRPRLRTVLGRGLRRRCPRCGEGELFRRWITVHDKCSVCGLVFQRDAGDTWMFLVLTDRIPLLFAIIALYFGFQTSGWAATSLYFIVLFVPLLATLRERQGLALALNYLVGIYLDEPAERETRGT